MTMHPGPLDGYRVAAPNCPPWCGRQHPSILSDYPTAATDVAPWVMHTTTLASAGPLTISYGRPEDLPDEPAWSDGPCYLTTHDDNHQPAATLPATVAELRAWAALLNTAADLAERMELD